MTACRHLGFCLRPHMTTSEDAACPILPLYQIWRRSAKRQLNNGIFSIFKMAAGRHIEFRKRLDLTSQKVPASPHLPSYKISLRSVNRRPSYTASCLCLTGHATALRSAIPATDGFHVYRLRCLHHRSCKIPNIVRIGP